MTKPFQRLEQIIEPAVAALGYELVGCRLYLQGGHNLLRIYVDGPSGIRLEDCVKISRQISALLDVEDPINARYDLEVSSPGIERPLFKAEHYRQFIGRVANVTLRRPEGDRRRYRGVIHAVTGEEITLKIDETLMVFALDNIEKANLVADFGV